MTTAIKNGSDLKSEIERVKEDKLFSYNVYLAAIKEIKELASELPLSIKFIPSKSEDQFDFEINGSRTVGVRVYMASLRAGMALWIYDRWQADNFDIHIADDGNVWAAHTPYNMMGPPVVPLKNLVLEQLAKAVVVENFTV